MEANLLWTGVIRKKYHSYPQDVREKLKSKKITIDSRSNGPAITSYLFAGGVRPQRSDGRKGWSIHHIYDGRFPFINHKQTLHAIKYDKKKKKKKRQKKEDL